MSTEVSRWPGLTDDARDIGGELLHETRPEFQAAVTRGRDLDLWDAVAIALGELGLSQTVP